MRRVPPSENRTPSMVLKYRLESEMVKRSMEMHPANGLPIISFRESGNGNDFSDLQVLKALSPMYSTPGPMSTVFRDSQYWNARAPMIVTVSGMETDVMDESMKASLPILVTV